MTSREEETIASGNCGTTDSSGGGVTGRTTIMSAFAEFRRIKNRPNENETPRDEENCDGLQSGAQHMPGWGGGAYNDNNSNNTTTTNTTATDNNNNVQPEVNGNGPPLPVASYVVDEEVTCVIRALLVVCSLILILLVILIPTLILGRRNNDDAGQNSTNQGDLQDFAPSTTPPLDLYRITIAPTSTTLMSPTLIPTAAMSTSSTLSSPSSSCHPHVVNYSNGFTCDDNNSSFAGDFHLNANAQCTSVLKDDGGISSFLRLTPAANGQFGTAFVPFTFSDCNKNNNTDYSFFWQIKYRFVNGKGDGMALILHQDPNGTSALGSSGGLLGVYRADNPTSPSTSRFIANAVVIEMDYYKNNEFENTSLPDHYVPAVQMVQVNDVGDKTNLAVVQANDLMLMKEGKFWVDYNGGNRTLNAYIDNMGGQKPLKPFITANIDLATVFHNSRDIFIGFAASNGNQFSNQDILSFTFIG